MIRQQNRKDYSFYCVRYLSVLNRKVYSGIQIYTVWLDSIFRFKVLNIIYKLNNNTIVVSISFLWRQKRSGRWFSFTSGSGRTTAPPSTWVFSPSKRTCGRRRVEWSVKYWFTVGKRPDNSCVVNLQLNLSHNQYCILVFRYYDINYYDIILSSQCRRGADRDVSGDGCSAWKWAENRTSERVRIRPKNERKQNEHGANGGRPRDMGNVRMIVWYTGCVACQLYSMIFFWQTQYIFVHEVLFEAFRYKSHAILYREFGKEFKKLYGGDQPTNENPLRMEYNVIILFMYNHV